MNIASEIWTLVLIFAASPAQRDADPPAPIHEAFPERAPADIAATAAATDIGLETLSTPAWFREGVNIHVLSLVSDAQIAEADRTAALQSGDIRPGPVRVGLARSMEPVPLSMNGGDFLETAMSDGRKVWTIAVRSPGACALRVRLNNFNAVDGRAVVYATDEQGPVVRGPYTGTGPEGDGDFWTPSLPGDTAFIEIVGSTPPRVEIAEIIHFDRDPAGHICARNCSITTSRICNIDGDCPTGETCNPPGPALPCHNDVMCYGVNPFARDAIGQMNFLRGGICNQCSGTLLNDLDSDTVVPYFLTAYHCLNTQSEANSLEVVWYWQKDACNGALPSYERLPRTIQGTLLASKATSGGNDMTFLRLNVPIPPGITLAGWHTGHPGSAYAIHHPAAHWKRVTYLSTVDFCPKCSFCGEPTDYDFYNFDDGILEGGSSGSGLFNSSGQLVGQYFGTCCVSVSCAGEDIKCSNGDEFQAMYGEFETTYPHVRRWLEEIGGTIRVDRAYGGFEEGTPSRPFRTVLGGYNFAWYGSRIKIQAGFYPERLTLSKQVTLVGTGGLVRIGQ